jgi:hypothetical protein
VILAAALLVLIALGLFVAGLLTGITFWYWACVAVSALAAVLLLVARRQLARAGDEEPARPRAREVAPPPPAEEQDDAEPEPARADPEPAGVAATEDRALEDRALEDHAPEDHAGSPPQSAGATASSAAPPAGGADAVDGSGDPPAEDVEVSDLLLVVEMHDDVFVLDEHPRYHLADCRWLADREAIPLPVDEARTDGFTPCGTCSPDRHLAQVARARKSAQAP